MGLFGKESFALDYLKPERSQVYIAGRVPDATIRSADSEARLAPNPFCELGFTFSVSQSVWLKPAIPPDGCVHVAFAVKHQCPGRCFDQLAYKNRCTPPKNGTSEFTSVLQQQKLASHAVSVSAVGIGGGSKGEPKQEAHGKQPASRKRRHSGASGLMTSVLKGKHLFAVLGKLLVFCWFC